MRVILPDADNVLRRRRKWLDHQKEFGALAGLNMQIKTVSFFFVGLKSAKYFLLAVHEEKKVCQR